jgi:hypothetical protein
MADTYGETIIWWQIIAALPFRAYLIRLHMLSWQKIVTIINYKDETMDQLGQDDVGDLLEPEWPPSHRRDAQKGEIQYTVLHGEGHLVTYKKR